MTENKQKTEEEQEIIRLWWRKRSFKKRIYMALRYIGVTAVDGNGKYIELEKADIARIHQIVTTKKSIYMENGKIKVGGSYYTYCHLAVKKAKGKDLICEGDNCTKKSKKCHWAIKKGKEYSTNPNDYISLCYSCHRKYDMTAEDFKRLGREPVLKAEQVVEVKELLRQGHTNQSIADKYGVYNQIISKIKTGKTWSHIK